MAGCLQFGYAPQPQKPLLSWDCIRHPADASFFGWEVRVPPFLQPHSPPSSTTLLPEALPLRRLAPAGGGGDKDAARLFVSRLIIPRARSCPTLCAQGKRVKPSARAGAAKHTAGPVNNWRGAEATRTPTGSTGTANLNASCLSKQSP